MKKITDFTALISNDSDRKKKKIPEKKQYDYIRTIFNFAKIIWIRQIYVL